MSGTTLTLSVFFAVDFGRPTGAFDVYDEKTEDNQYLDFVLKNFKFSVFIHFKIVMAFNLP